MTAAERQRRHRENMRHVAQHSKPQWQPKPEWLDEDDEAEQARFEREVEPHHRRKPATGNFSPYSEYWLMKFVI